MYLTSWLVHSLKNERRGLWLLGIFSSEMWMSNYVLVLSNVSSSCVCYLQSRHGALLSRTANLADPRSKSLAQSQTDSMKAILREGQGAAFLVQPCSGILEPFATLEVAVTAYSDMWGNYTDQLNCRGKRLWHGNRAIVKVYHRRELYSYLL